MARINDLDLGDDKLQVDYDNVPEQIEGFGPPPPPGTYRFRLPSDLSVVWDTFDATNLGKRLAAVFQGENSLTITQSPTGDYDGASFRTRITNAERKRNKEGAMASDMLYLLRALGDEARPAGNKGYADALTKHAGQEFRADVEWSAWCNDQKPKRSLNEDGSTATIDAEVGCGKRYYQRDIPRNEGAYADRFFCEDCDNLLYAFPNLVRFKPVQK